MAMKKICSRMGQALVVGLLIFIGLVPARHVSYGQSTNWTQPVTFERPGWFPEIATDASGRIYLAWSNMEVFTTKGTRTSRSGYDVVFFTSSTTGDTWDTTNEIAALPQPVVGNSEVTRPSLLVDNKGIMHMMYRDMYVHYSQAPVVEAASARNWSKPWVMSTDTLSYFSRMTMDSKGRIHMVYTQDVPTGDCLICYHVFYRYSDNNGKDWSQESDISAIPTGAAKPQILVDEQDNIHVAWEAGRGGSLGQLTDPTSVMYTVSYNRGETWSPPIEIVAPSPEGASISERSKNVAIGQDGSNNLVIAWWALPQDIPYYQVSSDHGLSWSRPEAIPGVWGNWANYNVRTDSYAMATDSAGQLHLIMVGRLGETDNQSHVLHLTWDGTAWSAPESIAAYKGDVPEWPRIAISNGNQLNVTWFVRPEDYVWMASPEYYKINYSRSRVNAPYLYGTPWPTLAPTSAVQITGTPTLSSTVMPTEPPKLNATIDSHAADEASYTEVGQINVLAMSLIPAVAVVALLLIIILIRRR